MRGDDYADPLFCTPDRVSTAGSTLLTTGFPGLALEADEAVLRIVSETPLAVLSSAVVGAELVVAQEFLVLRVPRDYAGTAPAADLQDAAIRRGVDRRFVGFMTAAPVASPRLALEAHNDLRVLGVATVGLGNLSAAGVSPPAPRSPGTINLLLFINGCLSRSGMVGAVITATEAKAAVLAARGLRTAEGWPASGTSTDALAIACTGRGPTLAYAGPVTTVGWLIGRTVRRLLQDPSLP
jgi:iron complex transport system ATP-binding protein